MPESTIEYLHREERERGEYLSLLRRQYKSDAPEYQQARQAYHNALRALVNHQSNIALFSPAKT